MKKKFLSFVFAICLMLPCLCMLTACNPAIVYTVTESQWEVNFNITKIQTQPLACAGVGNKAQFLSNDSSQTLEAITSYTLRAEGDSEGVPGSGLLKVAPNGMYMEFYIDGVLQQDETGTTPSTDPFYVGMTTMLKSYFPFSGKYNDFTFDQTKNAYVAQNLTSTVVDEADITTTYNLYNKKAEITFVNGYLNTVYIELCENDTFEDVYLSLVFTFSDINNTTVEI